MSRWNEMGLTLLDGAAVEAERPFTPCFNAPSPLGASLESGIMTHLWSIGHLVRNSHICALYGSCCAKFGIPGFPNMRLRLVP